MSRTGRQLAAPRSPTTLSRMLRPPGVPEGAGTYPGPRLPPEMSSQRAAYPSTAAWSKAGNECGATTSSARTLPYAWVRSRSSGGSARNLRSTLPR